MKQEHVELDEANGVTYLDAQAREHHRSYSGPDCRLRKIHGDVASTTHLRTHWHVRGGRAIFVMDSSGNLYTGPQKVGRFPTRASWPVSKELRRQGADLSRLRRPT